MKRKDRNDASAFDAYYEAGEPGRREKAYAWATAIGLQQVDGLTPSRYLIETAKRNIEGEITQAQARKLVDAYYETKEGQDQPDDVREADKVSARISAIVSSPSFTLSPAYFIGLHKQIFAGVYPHAGQVREVELTKREWVLKGESVSYAPSFHIARTLDYDFGRERKFRYKGLSDDAFVEHFAAFVSGIWQIHPFREGNTRTTALFAIKYLRSFGYDVTNDLFAKKSWYFRNALVRANYENRRLDVEKTQLPLEEFFKVLVFGADIELHNRFLRIGCEYGTPEGEAVKGLHRRGNVGANVGVNVGVNLTAREAAAAAALREDGRLTAQSLADRMGVGKRQAERILAALKRKAGLRREGSDKTGRWTFSGGEGR